MAIGIHSFEVDFFTKSIEEIAISDTDVVRHRIFNATGVSPLNYAIGAAFFRKLLSIRDISKRGVKHLIGE